MRAFHGENLLDAGVPPRSEAVVTTRADLLHGRQQPKTSWPKETIGCHVQVLKRFQYLPAAPLCIDYLARAET